MSRKTRKVWMIINLVLFIVLSILYLPTILEGNKIHLLIYVLFSIGLLKDVFLWKKEKESHSD
jgi:uncharacterized protein (DUF486 family)